MPFPGLSLCFRKTKKFKLNMKTKTGIANRSKILIVGGTGMFGRLVVEKSMKLGHHTVVLVRDHTIQSNPQKTQLVEKFKNCGVQIVYGSLDMAHEELVAIIKNVDVVISCVSGQQVPLQVNLISAIKEAGNIKRYFPSEYAIDVDRVHEIEPAASLFAEKRKIRRIIESKSIPYTYVVAYGFASRFIPNLAQMNGQIPDIDQVIVYGDGNSKIVCTMEEDIATYVIKAVDDSRTLNKNLYIRPPANVLSFNDLFALYEEKSGMGLEKKHISEKELLQMIQDAEFPFDLLLAVCYSVSIKNDYANFEIDPSFGVEASELYPEVNYITMGQYLDQLIKI